jgi:hypothetical protein
MTPGLLTNRDKASLQVHSQQHEILLTAVQRGRKDMENNKINYILKTLI